MLLEHYSAYMKVIHQLPHFRRGYQAGLLFGTEIRC